MATFRFAAVLTVCLVAASPAWAASGIAYGNRSLATASAPTSFKAAIQALESCSTRDTYCKLLLTCEERGAGAAAMSLVNGLVQSLGAVCGKADADQARDTAMQYCRDNGGSNCQVSAVWVE